MIRIIGGGLAGSEAAWQAASQGVAVTLHEMRPVRPTAVHKTDRLAELVCTGHLYFYDAISPIVLAETIDRSKVFRASRWNRSLGCDRARGIQPRDSGSPDDTGSPERLALGRIAEPRARACSVDGGEGDYLNSPFTREEYDRLYDALVAAESATAHDFAKDRFF